MDDKRKETLPYTKSLSKTLVQSIFILMVLRIKMVKHKVWNFWAVGSNKYSIKTTNYLWKTNHRPLPLLLKTGLWKYRTSREAQLDDALVIGFRLQLV